jgi:hypothetical protein
LTLPHHMLDWERYRKPRKAMTDRVKPR